jgi:protein SCO1
MKVEPADPLASPSDRVPDGLASEEGGAPPPPRLWMRIELWLGLALAGLIVPGVLFARKPAADPAPPSLGRLAPFTLVRESGAPFGSADLVGKVWVADFVYLGCTQSCPLLTTRMNHLASVLEEEGNKRGGPLPVRLVSFTIDPVNDTPDHLSEYAARWHANPATWAFATGPIAEVQHVVADGFKVAYGKVDDGAGAFEMMHGNYFVVVDRDMTIRGYYSTDRPEEMSHLIQDVLKLSTEPPAKAHSAAGDLPASPGHASGKARRA